MIVCISHALAESCRWATKTSSSSRANVMLPRASGVHRGEDPSGRLMRSSLLICFHVSSCNTLNYLLSVLLLQNAEKHSFKRMHLLMAPCAHSYLMKQDEEWEFGESSQIKWHCYLSTLQHTCHQKEIENIREIITKKGKLLIIHSL